jgi:hypothetical protein
MAFLKRYSGKRGALAIAKLPDRIPYTSESLKETKKPSHFCKGLFKLKANHF